MPAWINKFIGCLLASTAVLNGLFLIAELLPLNILQRVPMLASYLLLIQIVGGMIFGIVYATVWQKNEKAKNIDSERRYGLLLGILRCWLSFELSIYGFAKILGSQFGRSYIRQDQLFGQLSGFDLTWGYFGYSYAFAVIIAMAQIVGALLLLWRRTILLGVFILLPVMINIVLINVFYSIAFGAFFNSILISLALVYLLFWHRQVLWEMLKKAQNAIPEFRVGVLRAFLPLLVVGLAFVYIGYLARQFPRLNIEGKWSVKQMIRNGDTIPDKAWMTDSKAWKNIYIEPYQFISFCSNPYYHDEWRSVRGFYVYNQNERKLSVALGGAPDDSLRIQVTNIDNNRMQWRTIFNEDTLMLQLSRTEQ